MSQQLRTGVVLQLMAAPLGEKDMIVFAIVAGTAPWAYTALPCKYAELR
jgi:hypothetical protein